MSCSSYKNHPFLSHANAVTADEDDDGASGATPSMQVPPGSYGPRGRYYCVVWIIVHSKMNNPYHVSSDQC